MPLLNAVFFSCGALETLNYKTVSNMSDIEKLIEELIVIRSATHSQKDYNCFTICIEKAKEYLPKKTEHEN